MTNQDLHAQIKGNHQRGGNNEIKAWGILKGPIPYRIMWGLMILKVLHKLPRPIKIYMPKLGESIKEGGIMKLKHEGFSRVQYLMRLREG